MIWGGMIRHRDSKCLVSYPDRTLVDEREPPVGDGRPSWIDGWNVITDLYRIASLVMDDIDRQKSQGMSPRAIDPSHILHTPNRVDMEAVWPKVKSAYDALSPAFQRVPELVGDFSQDVYGFQAANLKVTLQVSPGEASLGETQVDRGTGHQDASRWLRGDQHDSTLRNSRRAAGRLGGHTDRLHEDDQRPICGSSARPGNSLISY